MARLTCSTAGESHGPALLALVEGMPAGLKVDIAGINSELARRQGGYGRGGRQKIEQDQVRILSGVLRGVTTGSPLAMQLDNKDSRLDDMPAVEQPRPGHADLAGALKYGLTDCRAIIERASARETAARVAAGALARQILASFEIACFGYVVQIGSVQLSDSARRHLDRLDSKGRPACLDSWLKARDASTVYCPDAEASDRMVEAIRAAKEAKDTLGGIVEVRIMGCPAGLGSCMRWQDKLDGRLMQAIASIQAIKAVGIGGGTSLAALPGRAVHDPIVYDRVLSNSTALGFQRSSNHAGGIEGGMTNGMPIVIQAAMKPISTLPEGLPSVDLRTLHATRAAYERSDVCAVPAASVVAENVAAFEVAAALVMRFGGCSMSEMAAAMANWRERAVPAARANGPVDPNAGGV